MNTLGKIFSLFSSQKQQPHEPSLTELQEQTASSIKRFEYAAAGNNALSKIVTSALQADEFKQENITPAASSDIADGAKKMIQNALAASNFPEDTRQKVTEITWPNFAAQHIMETHITNILNAPSCADLEPENLEKLRQSCFDSAYQDIKTLNDSWYQQTLSYFNDSAKSMPATLLIDIVRHAEETGLMTDKTFPQWFTHAKATLPEERYSGHLAAQNPHRTLG